MPLFRSFLLLLSIPLILTSARAAAAEATGFIHVKQIDGVWWFINPEGERFVSLGVNHIEPHLWLAPYNKDATLKRYGKDMVSSDGRFNTKDEAVSTSGRLENL